MKLTPGGTFHPSFSPPRSPAAPPTPPARPDGMRGVTVTPRPSRPRFRRRRRPPPGGGAAAVAAAWAAAGLVAGGAAWAAGSDALPGTLSSGGAEGQAAAAEQRRSFGRALSGPDAGSIQGCTRRCLPACLRGGSGAPGLGPLSLRKELIVFKDG